MTDLPLVSIVTPSYNQAAFLEQTMRSVLDQDYPRIEYLVVDGGSTDGSEEIITQFNDRLAWWISEPDTGQADGINKGLRRARGEIVAWLNSDDVYLPGAIRHAVEALQANPNLGMVFGDVVSIDADGEPVNVMHYGDWGLAELMQFNIIGQPGVFMRRSVLEKAGLLDESYHFLLDHHLWLRMARIAPVKYLPVPLAAARFHAGAKNVAQASAFGKEAYRIVEWMASEPAFAQLFGQSKRKIRAGAHRMNGRYLLDGGQPGAALRAYLKSVLTHPPTGFSEARRILFAAASLVLNVDQMRDRYLRQRQHAMHSELEAARAALRREA